MSSTRHVPPKKNIISPQSFVLFLLSPAASSLPTSPFLPAFRFSLTPDRHLLQFPFLSEIPCSQWVLVRLPAFGYFSNVQPIHPQPATYPSLLLFSGHGV